MSYKVTPDDYVEMCKYFESRSDFMKSTMLTVVPWLLAVAAGLIAFAFKEVLAGGKATLSRPAVAYILGMISLCYLHYCYFGHQRAL